MEIIVGFFYGALAIIVSILTILIGLAVIGLILYGLMYLGVWIWVNLTSTK